MENIIKKIATLFNKENITWALGGSWVLKKHGLKDNPHDIDIIVVEGDIDKANEVLKQIGKPKKIEPLEKYKTKYFYEYIVDGVDVDIMCKFVINDKDFTFEYLFDKQSISDVVYIDGVKINYSSIEDWYVLYRLMNREKDDLKAIQKYLINRGIKNTYLFERIMLDIPESISHAIVNELKIKRH